MNYTKEYINLLARKANLLKDNLEKVLRLSKILNLSIIKKLKGS